MTKKIIYAIESVVSCVLIGFCLGIIVWSIYLYDKSVNQKVADSGFPIAAKEELAKASRYHGEQIFEIRCQEYTFLRESDGRVCKAFSNLNNRKGDQ